MSARLFHFCLGGLSRCICDALVSPAFSLDKRLHTVDTLIRKLLPQQQQLDELNLALLESVRVALSAFEEVEVENEAHLAAAALMWMAASRHQKGGEKG